MSLKLLIKPDPLDTFGALTKKAVEDFQTAKIKAGINLGNSGPKRDGVDGVVGPRTCIAMGLMKRRKKVAPAPAAPATTPKSMKNLPNKETVSGTLNPAGAGANPVEREDPLEESVDFYDKKKLLEAKKIFGRLIKALL